MDQWLTLLTQREVKLQDRKLQILESVSSRPEEAQAQNLAMKTDCLVLILSSGCYQLCGLGLSDFTMSQLAHL